MLLESVLTGAVRGGTSILFATLGETVVERSGGIYLGTEGSMLSGALAAYIVGVETGNPWLGVLAGIAAGAFLALIHAGMVLWRGANQIATGLVVTFLAIGATALFGQDYVGVGVEPIEDVAIPGLADLPFIGPVLFDHDPLTYLSFALAPIIWWVFYRTRSGLMLRSAGERPEVLRTYGTSPQVVRLLALLVGGGLAGLGGAQLSTAFALNWSEQMTAGRGFVAVALVIFAAWNPLKAVAGAYLFSGTIALQLQLQARGWEISPYLLQALPYLLVVVVLAALSRKRAGKEPEALTHVFHDHVAA
jgi:simple sugar transport system permease protein